MSSSDPKADIKADTFAALFEEQASKAGPRARSVRVGEALEATVVQVGRESVFLELDGKRQAYIDAVELRDADGNLTVQVGDRVAARVLEIDGNAGTVRVGRVAPKGGGAQALESARASGIPIEGKVSGTNKGGLEVECGGVRAFCPNSQVEAKFVKDLSAYVGQTLSFLVMEVRDGGRSVVLSRRALLEREAKEAAASDSAASASGGTTVTPTAAGAAPRGGGLSVGAVVTATVDRIENYGVFVQVDGAAGRAGRGLIPNSELGVPRTTDVRGAFPVGTKVTATILDVGEGKLRLSIRGAKDAAENAEFRGYKAKAPAPKGFGTLGDLLAKRGEKTR